MHDYRIQNKITCHKMNTSQMRTHVIISLQQRPVYVSHWINNYKQQQRKKVRNDNNYSTGKTKLKNWWRGENKTEQQQLNNEMRGKARYFYHEHTKSIEWWNLTAFHSFFLELSMYVPCWCLWCCCFFLSNNKKTKNLLV